MYSSKYDVGKQFIPEFDVLHFFSTPTSLLGVTSLNILFNCLIFIVNFASSALLNYQDNRSFYQVLCITINLENEMIFLNSSIILHSYIFPKIIFLVAYRQKILFKNHLNYNFYSVITFSIRKISICNTEEYLEPSQTCKVNG